MPRVSVASATRPTATMYAAVRMSTLCFFDISRTSLNDFTMTSLRRAVIVALRPEPFAVGDRPVGARRADDGGAGLRHQLGGEAAGVPEPLHDDARPLEVHPGVLARLDDRVHGAARRPLVPSFAPADGKRLPG